MTPEEIRGFSSTVLVLEADRIVGPGELRYRKRSRSDVKIANEIDQDEESGAAMPNGDQLYIPTASGFYHDGKPHLLASIDRYTRVHVNGHRVLMRDDALRAYREQGKLYDYGILFKVSDAGFYDVDLKKVKSPSIKLLYSDPDKPWRDPFVHGPNER